ncbi:unnamed protein product, partial [Prorocentrum cordatum]
ACNGLRAVPLPRWAGDAGRCCAPGPGSWRSSAPPGWRRSARCRARRGPPFPRSRAPTAARNPPWGSPRPCSTRRALSCRCERRSTLATSSRSS